MATLTWGSGGAHSTLGAARAAATWDQNNIFQQVGASTETGTAIGDLSQNGFTATIIGNGDTITLGTNYFVYMSSFTGDTVIENCVTSGGNEYSGIIRLLGSGTSAYKMSVRFCKFIGAKGGYLQVGTTTAILSKIEFFANYLETNITVNGFPVYISDNRAGVPIYFEDIFIWHRTSSSGVIYIDAGDPDTVSEFYAKRIYIRTARTDIFQASTGSPNILTETYAESNAVELGTDNKNQTFNTTFFESVTEGEDLYGIPKTTTTMYINATQTSNIPDNVIGLNGVEVTYRAAGAFTPVQIVSPPSNITWSAEPEGVKIDWTPNVQTGFEDVDVYWEMYEPESYFVTPKVTIPKGTNTYTIPYSQLLGANIWYVRLSHAEEV